MFGRPTDTGNGRTGAHRRAAADAARIEGGGLIHVIVTSLSPVTFYLFVNEQPVDQMAVESLEVNIDTGEGGGDTSVRASLSRYVATVTGGQSTQYTNLFPSTVEIIAVGRRILITAEHADSLENLFVSLGLRADGTTNDLKGLRSLNVMITNVLFQATLTW